MERNRLIALLRRFFGTGHGGPALDENEVRVAQSVALVRQMPMIIIGNGIGSTIGYLFLEASEVSHDLTPLGLGIWLLLLPMLISWLRLRGRALPQRVSKRRIRRITIYSGVLGTAWAALELWYLPTVPFSVSAFLMASCAFLAVSAVTTIFVMPWACVAYAAPMMGAAIYISARSEDPVGGPFVGLLLLMSFGIFWFLTVNWRNFLTMLELSAEKSRLLVQLASDLQTQKELVEAKDEATAALRKANLALKALAQTDLLTNLPNRRGFEQTLRREWLRMQATGYTLSLLMVDADHFKAINDRHGHKKGDECLRIIAAALEASVRAGDTVSRYGGEEFAVILPGLAASDAFKVAERMRSTVESSGAAFGLTISIGIATCHTSNALTTSELMEQADNALFRAKQGGRNQLVLAAAGIEGKR
jgi:diguanylate cyclase (GGDEF)-like protein